MSKICSCCCVQRGIVFFNTSCLFFLSLGSLVSKDDRSHISQIHMPSPYTTAGLCPKTLHLDLVIPLPEGIRSRSSLQSVLEARTLPLSYRGRADASCLFIGYLSKGYVLVFLLPNPGSLAQGLSLGAAAKENRLPK